MNDSDSVRCLENCCIPRRIAMLSVHTSPLAPLGGKKTGGMNVYVREVAAAFGRRGIKVDVFTREDSLHTKGAIETIGKNARLIYLPAGPAEALSPDAILPFLTDFRDALLQFTRDNQLSYDFIYSHYWLSGQVARTLKQVWKVPFVQMFHTLGYMKERILPHDRYDEKNAQINPIQNRRIEIETEIMNSADRLVAATPAERIQMLWLYRADRRLISVVSPGVDLEHFSPMDQAEARKAIGVSPEDNILLFVGRIEPLKAVDTICEALNIIRENQPAVLDNLHTFIIGGDPADQSSDNQEMLRLMALCEELGLDNVIEFIGSRDQDILPCFYNAATALIMPSDYESFGMVALEAMACGTPVIASRVGGLAFLVDEGQTGFQVPVRDPHMLAERIQTLLTDPDLRQEMGQNANAAARRYSWTAITDQLLEVFSSVLIEHSPVCVYSG